MWPVGDDDIFVMMSPFYLQNQPNSGQRKPSAGHVGIVSPFSCRRHHLCSSKEIERHLPEEGVYGILYQSGEPGPEGIVVKMREAKVLFNNIAFFRYLLVSFYFIVRQLCRSRVLSHDSVRNLVHREENSIWLSKVSLIGIYLFDRVFGVTTASDTKGKIGTVIMGCRRYLGGKDESMAGVDRGVLFEPKVRDIIFHRPVGIEIARVFERFSHFVHFAFGSFSFLFFFFQLFRADGTTGGFHQAGVNGDALVYG